MGITTAPARIAEFRQALAAGVLTTDGGMGTMLRSILDARGRGVGPRGAFQCLEELNLSLAAVVRDVHQEYLRAGAQVLGTNTFGANRKRLSESGFGDKTRAINQAGVRITREAARSIRSITPEAFVAGVVGPLGVPLEPLGLTTRAEARAIFGEQMNALVESGVDLLVLETFQDLAELEEAIAAAREAAGTEMTVVAQVSVEEDGSLLYGTASSRGEARGGDTTGGTGLRGTPILEFARRLEEWPVDVIGVNCSFGPSVVLETIEKLAVWTTKPLSAKPSAGLPALVDGRAVYPCTPEYMAEYAVRFAQTGAHMVGGCCGTTPEHIRHIRVALQDVVPEPFPRVLRAVQIQDTATPEEPATSGPAATRSDLATRLAAGQFVAMAEMWAPRGMDASQEIAAAIELKRSGMEFVAVMPARGRMSALAACHVIQQQGALECVLEAPGFDRRFFDFESALLGAYALGIRNLVCGVEGVGSTGVASSLGLFVGVRVNPGAPDPEQQLRWFERHVNSGAAFVLTDPVFDADVLEEFLKRIEPYQLPVIAGIRPLAGVRDAMFLMNERRTPVPAAYLERLRRAERQGGEEGAIIAREMVEIVADMTAGICLSGHAAPYQFPGQVVDAIAARR